LKKVISAGAAANALLAALGALALFHLLMLARVLPPDLAWGGRMVGPPGLLTLLEIAGLVVTALFAAVVAAKAGFWEAPWAGKVTTIAVWVVFGYFVLNTSGNLLSTSPLERAIFTPVSAILALLALRLAAED
jgi:hypothetical protein